MTCHWVRHSKMKPIDFDELFNINVIVNKLELILNFNLPNRSISSRRRNTRRRLCKY